MASLLDRLIALEKFPRERLARHYQIADVLLSRDITRHRVAKRECDAVMVALLCMDGEDQAVTRKLIELIAQRKEQEPVFLTTFAEREDCIPDHVHAVLMRMNPFVLMRYIDTMLELVTEMTPQQRIEKLETVGVKPQTDQVQ